MGEQRRPGGVADQVAGCRLPDGSWQAGRRGAGSSRPAASARSRLAQASYIARQNPASKADEQSAPHGPAEAALAACARTTAVPAPIMPFPIRLPAESRIVRHDRLGGLLLDRLIELTEAWLRYRSSARVVLFAINHAADVSSLPDLLKVVAGHAYESYPQGYGRVPPLIDNAIEVGIGHCTNEPNCHLMYGVEVAVQHLGVSGDRGNLLGGVPIACVGEVKWQAPPLRPTS